MKQKLFSVLALCIVLIGLAWFFSYRILSVPLALTSDEGGFGVNAVYLSRTLRDENGVFLPVFALSLGRREWRQPVTQYYQAVFFKLFGESFFNLRFSSVVITLVCTVLIYGLASLLLSRGWGIFAAFIFLTIPLVMIQSHLALDNIMPVPFVLLWLIFVTKFTKTEKLKYLIWAGISLGIGFYTYKGMRATVPVWCVLTVLYLFFYSGSKFKSALLPIATFAAGTAPFFLVTPLLESRYPGAVWDRKGFKWESWYVFMEPFLSSFDLSFLFVRGDATMYHSTGKHGMMLLTSLPLFIVGIYESVRKKKIWGLVLAAFFTAPLLFGMVNSIHRASRLMSMIPPFVLLATLGAKQIWQNKKILLIGIVFLMVLNYGDFVYFYWNKYPELTRNIFGDAGYFKDYELFVQNANKLNLDKYVSTEIAGDDGTTGELFQLFYLDENTKYLTSDDSLPENGILLSLRGNISGLVKLDVPRVKYSIHVQGNQ